MKPHKCMICLLLSTYNLTSIRLQGLPVRPNPIPNLKNRLRGHKFFGNQKKP